MSQDSVMHDDEGAVPATLPSDPSRRLWIGTTCAMGGVAGLAAAVPFVSTFAPSDRARAAGAPVGATYSVHARDALGGASPRLRLESCWVAELAREQAASGGWDLLLVGTASVCSSCLT